MSSLTKITNLLFPRKLVGKMIDVIIAPNDVDARGIRENSVPCLLIREASVEKTKCSSLGEQTQ